MDVMEVIAIVGTIVIPIFIFMLAMRPFLIDAAERAVRDIFIKQTEMEKRLENIESKIDSLERRFESKIDSLEKRFDGFVDRFDVFLLNFESKATKNPLSPEIVERRRYLTQKLKAGTITHDEAVELNEILEKELEEAKVMNDVLAIVAILLLLGLVAAFLSKSS